MQHEQTNSWLHPAQFRSTRTLTDTLTHTQAHSHIHTHKHTDTHRLLPHLKWCHGEEQELLPSSSTEFKEALGAAGLRF